MGKASTKHFNQRKITLPAFPMGIDWSQPPEIIADGALTDAKNTEYNHINGALRTAPGVSIRTDYSDDEPIYGDTTPIYGDETMIYVWNLPIKSLWYDKLHDTYLFSSDTKLYKTDLVEPTEIGDLTGVEKPCYALFGEYVLVASGGHLQYYDGTNLYTMSGYNQVETATVVGTITTAGNATVIVTSNEFVSSQNYSVALDLSDTASMVATKIRAAFSANSTLTGLYTVGGTGANVTLTRIEKLGNDSTLNISIENDTCVGLTNDTTSTDTTSGLAPSPLCTFVMDDFGRVLVVGYDDRMDESGIGDGTNWTNIPSDNSSAQFLYVGYKDSGKITAVRMFGSDLIISKDSGRLYRRTGQYPNWSLTELSRKADCLNKNCMLSVGNNVYFFGEQGFKSLATVVDYGDIKQADVGQPINSRLNIDSTAHMWLIEPKKQIWIRPNNDRRVYIFHYSTGAFTYREFKHVLTDVTVVGDDVFVSYANKIGYLDVTTDKDDGQQIVTVIKSKRYLPERLYTILKYTKFQAENIIAGNGLLEVGETKIGIVFTGSGQPIFNNNAPIYQNTTPIKTSSFVNVAEYGGGSNEELIVTLTVMEGAIEIRSLDLETAEV